jgi:hypothetical protein
MQNSEELRQKGHDIGVEKRHVARGENLFRRGWGINVVFGPKYRPVTYVEKKYAYHKLILPSLRTEAL